MTFKLLRGQNNEVCTVAGQPVQTLLGQTIREAARLLDRWEYIELESIDWTEKRNYMCEKKSSVSKDNPVR